MAEASTRIRLVLLPIIHPLPQPRPPIRSTAYTILSYVNQLMENCDLVNFTVTGRLGYQLGGMEHNFCFRWMNQIRKKESKFVFPYTSHACIFFFDTYPRNCTKFSAQGNTRYFKNIFLATHRSLESAHPSRV